MVIPGSMGRCCTTLQSRCCLVWTCSLFPTRLPPAFQTQQLSLQQFQHSSSSYSSRTSDVLTICNLPHLLLLQDDYFLKIISACVFFNVCLLRRRLLVCLSADSAFRFLPFYMTAFNASCIGSATTLFFSFSEVAEAQRLYRERVHTGCCPQPCHKLIKNIDKFPY